MTTEDPDKVPHDQWNALIAQRCGLHNVSHTTVIQRRIMRTGWWHTKSDGTHELIPDYVHSLDAMALAEATLMDEQAITFYVTLATVCRENKENHWSTNRIHATAKHRARAFLIATEP